MRQILFFIGLMLCVAPPLQAQPSALQTQAEQALVADDPATTVARAQDILATAPQDYAAWFLLALGQADLGNDPESAKAAAEAYRYANSETERFQAARLVAAARTRLGHYARSEFWLRRAANHTSTDQEAEAVVRAYIATVRANPLSVNITASIAPSDNVNSGSDDGILRFEGIDITFRLPENRTALSGIEYAGSADITYRLSDTPVHNTYLTGYFFADTYTLSQSSRDLLDGASNPDVRAVTGRDFSSTVAQIGIRHQRADILPLGPTSLSFDFGTYWSNDTRLVNYQDYVIQQDIPINRDQSFVLRASMRDQQALLETLIDTQSYDLVGVFDQTLANRDQLQLIAKARRNEAGFENSFDEYRLGLGYGFAQPLLGTRWSTYLEVGYRDYEEYFTTLDGRQDRIATAGLNTVFEQISYFGFSPSLDLTATRTRSNAEEVESTELQVRVGITSNF